MLYGREPERSRIGELLDGARESRSAALVISGEPGVGKSALLEDACEQAGDMRVLRGSGVESEAHLPFAALHQVVRPILDLVENLPEPQAVALRGALGLAARGSDDRFLISLAALSLLAEAAEREPLLCLVDDAHWLDDASAGALVFVARRLEAEGIVMLFTVREGESRRFEARGLPELRLGGLDPAAAGLLIERHVDVALSAEVRERLIADMAGNPLALIELSSVLSPAQLAGAEPVLTPIPVSARVERAFLERVRRLPEETQTLLLVAAADDTGELATVLRAAAQLGAEGKALDSAEQAGLAQVRAGRLELRHPLVRSAVYQGAPLSQRQAVHRTLASVLTGDVEADRRAWHRAAASVEPDPSVVEELEQAAQRAHCRGGFAAASLALERAAALTVDDHHRAGQLAAAGENAWIAGHTDRARVLLGRARPLAAGPLLRADIDRIRGLIDLNSGLPADAGQLLLRAATEVAEFDVGRALHLLGIASLAATHACDTRAIVEIGDVADRITPDDTATARLLAHHLRGLPQYYAGNYAEAIPRLRAALELAEGAGADESPQTTELLNIASSVGLILGDDRAVRELHRRMVARARDAGALEHLTWALTRLAVSEIWAGHWASASAVLTEALELSRPIGQHLIVAYLLSELAIVAALRGEEEECRALADESLELASGRGLAYIEYIAHSALLALDLGLGRADEALRQSQSVTAMPGLDCQDALDRIEAAVRAGQSGVAQGWIDPFNSWAENCGSPWARGAALHCRALLADDPADAERLFLGALEAHGRNSRPFERARAEFAFGEFLRRSRRRVEARKHLRAALNQFEMLGATLWAERARVELRASGQTARRRDLSTRGDLTAQELQIARFVAEGWSNRDVAARLFLSPRTIDFHLRNIFRKLEISSRVVLARLDLSDEALNTLVASGSAPSSTKASALSS